MSSAKRKLDAQGSCGHVAHRSVPGDTPTAMLRRVAVTDWKDVSNVFAWREEEEIVLTRQFTKRSTLDNKDGCQGLSHGKKSGTCQHVLLELVPTLTLARRTSWNGMQRVHRHLFHCLNCHSGQEAQTALVLESVISAWGAFLQTISILPVRLPLDDLKPRKINFNKLVFSSCN